MQKLLYGNEALPLDGSPLVEYSLIIDEVSVMDGQILCEYYGVQVDLGLESVQIRHITASQRGIYSLLEKLKNGKVTPTGVHDIVDDWLVS